MEGDDLKREADRMLFESLVETGKELDKSMFWLKIACALMLLGGGAQIVGIVLRHT